MTPVDAGNEVTVWKQADCLAVMDKLARAGCSDQNTYAQAKASMCSKVPTSRAITCAKQFTQASHCQELFINEATVTCRPTGETDTSDIWVSELLKAANCARSTNDNQCFGASCNSGIACTANSNCNTVTGKCVSLSNTCIGLPCAVNDDCPANHFCAGSLCAAQ